MALKGRRSTPEERLQAVQLLKEGNEAAAVARMYNVSRAMLFRWQQKYDQGGPVALETKKTPGPASRLSPTQLSKLYAIITRSDPRQLEFDFGLWTRKIIRELIRREFKVKEGYSGARFVTRSLFPIASCRHNKDDLFMKGFSYHTTSQEQAIACTIPPGSTMKKSLTSVSG